MKTAHDLVQEAKAQIHEVPLEEAQAAINDAVLLLDVREGDEYHAGHIPGAVSIPRGLLEFKLSNDPALDLRDQPIVIYCKTSGRAALAAATMKNMGYLHVQSIEGGFDTWQGAGKPVITPEMPDFE